MITVVYPSSSDPLNPPPAQELSAPPTPPIDDAYLRSAVNVQHGGLITVVPPSASDNNNPTGGSVPVAPVPVDDATYEKTVNKGKPNGYAALDQTGKVPAAQLPAQTAQGSPVSVSTWDSIQGKPGAFPPQTHAQSHAANGGDPLTLSRSQVSDWPATFPPDASAVQTASVGQPNGVASLGSDGKVPSAQLPAIAAGSGDMLRSTYDTNGDGVVDHAALADVASSVSYNNVTNTPGLATTTASGFCPPFDGTSIVLSGGKLTATGGAGGGTGDMTKAVYDANNDGIVDHATLADAAPYSGITGKPTLGTASPLDVAASGDAASGQVVKGSDSRLTNARTPAAHATSHASGGSDAVSILKAQVSDLGTIGTAAALNVPATGNAASGEVVKGSDTRLSDSRTPNAHAASHKSGGSDALKIDELAAGTDVTTLNASTTVHGLLPKLSGTSTQYLNGSGGWSTPAGTGGAGDMTSADYAAGTGASNTTFKVDHALYADAAPYSGITGTPTLGTAAAKDIAATGNASSTQVVYGTDTRLTDSRTPTAHETSHVTGGSDVIPAATTSASGLVPVLPATLGTSKFLNGATAWAQVDYSNLTGTPTLGTAAAKDIAVSGDASSTQVVYGTDSRLTNARTPSAHAATHASGGSDAVTLVKAQISDFPTLGTSSALNVAATGNAASGEVVKGSDTRLTDARTPAAHESTHVTGGSDVIPAATTSASGLVPILPATAATAKFLNGASAFAQVAYADVTGTPTLGSSSSHDVATTGNATSTQVVLGNDGRLSDARTPTGHESTHVTGGSDVIPAPTTSASGLVPILPATGATAKFLNGAAAFAQVAYADVTGTPTLGTAAAKDIPAAGNASSTQVVYGSDTRLTDSRTPSAHAASHASAGSDPVTIANTQVTGLGTSSTLNVPASGNAASGEVVKGSDTRLSDARTPAAHASTHLSGGSDPISAATATASGLVPTPPNNVNKWYKGDSSWDYQEQATETNGTFTVPAAGSTVAVTIVSASWPVVGQTVLITDGTRIGFFEITVVTSATSITVANRGFLGNSTSGLMATGSTVRLMSPGVATATQPGFVPVPPNDATKVLTGAMTYAAVAYANVTGTPTLGTSAAKDIPASGNASSTQVVYGTDTRLTDARTPTAHAASHQSGGSDAIALDTLGATTDITTLNATTLVHGLLPKLGGGTTNFFRADGTYAALPANSTTVAGTVAASPNNTNKVYLGDSTWGFLGPQTETNGTFVVPAAGSTVAVTIVSAAWPVVGQTVWISDGTRVGFFEITVVTSATSITVKNQGYLGNSVSGTMATGSIVKLVGPNVATSTKPGFVPTPPNDATKFLDGTAAFSVVNYNNLSNLPTLGTSAAKDIPASGNASSTQVVYGSDTRLSDSRTPTAHATSHKSGGSDSIKLDELAATTDVTTLNASITSHGLLPKLSNVSTQYLDGTGVWSTPAGGGGGGGVGNITTTNASFTCPAAGATVSVTFTSTTGFVAGLGLWIDTAGLFYVSSVTSGTVAVMLNVGQTGNATSGTIATAKNVWVAGVSQPSTATLPGYVPTPPNVASQFLNGLSAWAVPVMKPFKVWVAGLEYIPSASTYGVFTTTNSRPFVAFNDAATWTAMFMTTVPTGASLGGGFIVRIKWLSIAATTGAAVWGVAIERMNTNQNADSFDTQVTATTTTNGTVKTLVETAITITTIDSITAGDGLLLQVQRIGGNASDSLVGDALAELISIETVN